MVSLLGSTPEHLVCMHNQGNTGNTLVGEGTISAADLDLFQVIDTPQEVVNAIFDYYEHKGFEPSEQEKLLEL